MDRNDLFNRQRDILWALSNEPGWSDASEPRGELPGWLARAVSALTLLADGKPPLIAAGHYADGEGVAHIFTEQRILTLEVHPSATAGDDPVCTTTARPRRGLLSVELDAQAPAFNQGFPRDWPGSLEVRLTYRDGLVVEFLRGGGDYTRKETIAQALPDLLADLEGAE